VNRWTPSGMARLGALCMALLCAEASHAQAPTRLRAWNIHPDGYPVTEAMKGFAGPLCSSLVHDVNLVSGALSALGLSAGRPSGTTLFKGDSGVAAIAQVVSSGAPLSFTWHAIPKLAHYSERLTFTFEDALFELRFPSPYLNHQPTELIERRSSGLALRETLHRPSYAEAFVEEMRGFHGAVANQKTVVNTVEAAGTDMELLVGFGRLAIAG